MKIALRIRSNEGYDAEQATERHNTLTVRDLREALEGYEDDTEIVTLDLNNRYGADWGIIARGETIEEIYDDEEEDED